MSAFNRFARSWRGAEKATGYNMPLWGSSLAQRQQWGEAQEEVDYSKAVDRYLTNDLIFMCIKKLGDFAADARLVLFPSNAPRDPATGLPELDSALTPQQHSFYDLWRQPNPWDSKAEFLEAIIITLLLSPKGVFLHLDDGQRPPFDPINRTRRIALNGEPVAMWWLLPEAMKVIPDKDRWIKEYIHEVGGEKTFFDPDAVVRVMEFNPRNRYDSISRIQPINLASATDIAAQKADYALFRNSMRVSGIVESDRDHIDPDELKLLEKEWKEAYTSPDNWGKFLPLWAGFKFTQQGITPADAQSDETARRNRMRIFGTLGVHPGVILSEDVNLANAKVAEHVTRAFTLQPLLRRVADEITPILKYFSGPEAEAHFIGVVPQDDEATAEIDKLKAESANIKAQAINNLITALGPETGVMIAKEWQIIPNTISADEIIQREVEQRQIEEQRRQANLEKLQAMQQGQPQNGAQPPAADQAKKLWRGHKADGTIIPSMPAIPEIDAMDDAPPDDEIERMLKRFYQVFPDLTGILETNGKA